MIFTSVLAAGALALQASAFLLPLEATREAGVAQIDKELKHQVVELDCPQCPFAGSDGDGSIWIQEDSLVNIHLEFDITDDDQFLQINGQPVFPPPQTLVPVNLKAAEVRSSDQSRTQPLRLGYALEVLPAISHVTDIALTPIQLTILDLQGVPVKVDTIKIDLIQSWGHMHIARITRLPFSQSPGGDCTSSICRLRAIIADRLRKMVDAAKAHAGKAKTWIKNGCWGRKPAQASAEQDQVKPHREAHHKPGRLLHFMEQTIRHLVMPVVFGVLGALSVIGCCIFGYALGRLISGALGYLLNRGWRRDDRLENLEAAIEVIEKEALMEGREMPPQYEDVDIVVEQK